MGILDFFSREAGQQRRAALDEFGRDVGYYVPPELRGLLGFAAEMTPSATLDRASQKSSRMLAPGRTPMQRVGDAGEMLSEVAGVVAPVAVAGRAGMTGAQALQEAYLGFSAPARATVGMGLGRVEDALQPMFARQVEDFVAANQPRVAAPSMPPNTLAVVPTAAEIPHLPVGVTEFTYPVTDAVGTPVGGRPVAAMSPEQVDQLRPGFLDSINVQDVDMPKGIYGSAGYSTNTVSLNSNLAPEMRQNVLQHELSHFLGRNSGLNRGEHGSNATHARASKNAALRSIREQLGQPDLSAAQRDSLRSTYDDIAGLTVGEVYSRNPGEAIARMAGQDPTMVRRLTPAQVFNPTLNPEYGPTRRAAQALGTKIFSDTGPFGRFLSRISPVAEGLHGYDKHFKVPLDMSSIQTLGINPAPGFVPGQINPAPGLLPRVGGP